MREDLVLGEVEYVGESERRTGVNGLHRISLLTVDIGADLELMAAVYPAQAVMHDVVVMLEAVVSALVEARADAGDVPVGQVARIASREGIMASGADD